MIVQISVLSSVVYLDFIVNLALYLVAPVAVTVLIWKSLGIKPTSKLVYLVLMWVVMWVVWKLLSLGDEVALVSIREAIGYLLVYGSGLVVAVVLLDALCLLSLPKPIMNRVLPARFASGVGADVTVKVSNTSGFWIKAKMHDGLPNEAHCSLLPWEGGIPSRGYTEISYPLEFTERGDAVVDEAFIEYGTKLSFWTRCIRAGSAQETKVYPNYEPIVRYALLTMESRPEQMGIVMKNKVGMSKEFHQLRDYQLGDMLSQIDWKATSKHRSLISRDFQEQKDQSVILLIDCGRRMRAYDGDIPQFDHCLNAMLLLSYVALKQGDHVGVLSFGGQERWLAPVKGVNSMKTLLNHLYDYKSSNTPSDFSEATERLLTHQQRRALVIVLTNVRGEDADELIEPLKRMNQKHVVMLANLQEKEVVERYEKDVQTLDDALEMTASKLYFDERESVMNQLEQCGIQTVASTAQHLPVALANQYLTQRHRV